MFSLLIKSKFFVPQGYKAMTIFPFIFYRGEMDQVTYNHESIHIRQQMELLILPFFIWYFIDYIIGLFKYGSHNKAYRNIIFEREAYENQDDISYLHKRKIFQYLR